MACEFEINGDLLTVTFTYTADLDKGQAAIANAAENEYPNYPVYEGEVDPPATLDPVPFAELTNQHILSIMNQFVKDTLMDSARANLVDVAVIAARDAAMVDDSISLGDE